MLCSRKFLVAKKFMGGGWCGLSQFSVENFLSHSAENFRRRPLYFFINFGYRKMLGIREGVTHVFRSKIFCLTVPKSFVGEPFCAVLQKVSGMEEIYGEEGGLPGFHVEKFLSHSSENFRR